MTIERARELLNLSSMTDAEVSVFIAESKRACRAMLKTIMTQDDSLTEEKQSN